MSCAGVEPRSEADCEYTLDSGMLIKDIGYRCYSQIWNCYSYGKLIKGDETDLIMLKEIENNPDCHEFISQEELMKELNM